MSAARRLALAALAATMACTDPSPVAVDGSLALDAATATDAATCFAGAPRTRLELLNRCTDAETANKTVTLPLLRADGSRPPLP